MLCRSTMSNETDLEIQDGCGIENGCLVPPAETRPHRRSDASCVPAWLTQLHDAIGLCEDEEEEEDIAEQNAMIAIFDHTRLRGSKAHLEAWLRAPFTTDANELRRRQRFLKAVEANGCLDDPRAAEDEKRLVELEPDVLWFFRVREDPALRELCDTAYFGTWWPSSVLNRRVPSALSAMHVYRIAISPWIGVLSPIVYFVVPYLALRFRGLLSGVSFTQYLYKLAASAVGDVIVPNKSVSDRVSAGVRCVSATFSLVLYFHSVLSNFEQASALKRVGGTISTRVAGAREFLATAERLAQRRLTKTNEGASALLSAESVRLVQAYKEKTKEKDGDASSPRPPTTGWRDLGARLCDASKFDHAEAGSILKLAYELDAVASIVRLRRERGGMCWTEFVDANGGDQGPLLDMKGLNHPCIDRTVSVENDWTLGHRTNALLTGPNAGGKSTLMRSALTTVLLSQTLTIASCSKSCRMTPFSFVASHLGVADLVGSESLFQAEMKRALEVIRRVQTLERGEKALVILDEVFSSTNPIEGISAAAAIARKLGSHTNDAIAVISTHYLPLARMLDKTLYARVCMPIQRGPGGGLLYPHRLQKGLCRQVVALELMRRAGFDADVLDDALEVQDRLIKRGSCAPPGPPLTDDGASQIKEDETTASTNTTDVEQINVDASVTHPDENRPIGTSAFPRIDTATIDFVPAASVVVTPKGECVLAESPVPRVSADGRSP